MKGFIDVQLDTKRFTRHLTSIARSQVPFATAKALTQTAKDAQKDTQQAMTGAMRLRSNWVKSGLRITPARKSDGMHRMKSVVGHRDWYMAQQLGARTITRKSKAADYQYIPRGIRRTKTGKISKAQRPANILKKRNVFMTETGKGRAAIYRRTKSKITLLYSAVKRQTVKPSMSLHKTVETTARKKLSRNWVRAMSQAMRTAR